MTITTCDAQGKPVAAEVSLAVLPSDRGTEAALAGRPMATFFHRHGRAAEFRTASSIQFHYQPANRAIGSGEPEEDSPPLPAHIAGQQGIEVVKPAANGDSQADFEPLRELIENTVKEKPAEEENPFGNGPSTPADGTQPATHEWVPRYPVPGTLRQPDQEARVSRIAPPTWPGYWNPAVATGPDGRATISLTLPEDAAKLTLVAKAITPDTVVGQAVGQVVLTKELSAAIHLPPAFTDGDEMELPVVVENRAVDHGTLEVALNVNVDGVEWNEKRILEVKSRGRVETSFKTTIRQLQRPMQEGASLPTRPQAVFTVTAKAGGTSDVCRRCVPVLPYGMPYRVTASGVAERDATLTIAPSCRHWTAPTLRIAVSPTIERSLLDVVAPAAEAAVGGGAGGSALRLTHPTRSDDEAQTALGSEGLPAASDLMAALALKGLYPPDSPEASMLDERIRTALSLLVAGQQAGLWSMNRRSCTVETVALAHWSLVLADKAGFDVPGEVFNSSLNRLRGSTGPDQESDLECKAIVLHALAISGEGDFALANHLLRDRKLLSPLGRAYLALALIRMDRKESAADVLGQASGVRSTGFSRKAGEVRSTGFSRKAGEAPLPPEGGTTNDVEAQSLTALALLGIDPASQSAKTLIDSILGQRTGLRWTPERATGPAVLAAATWLEKNRASAGPCRLAIMVNGKAMKTLDFDPRGLTQTVNVPLAMLVKGRQQIELHASGPARLAYRCTLGGVEPAEFVHGDSAAWNIRRSYEPGPMEVDESEVPPGFSILAGDVNRGKFANRLTQLPAARRGSVELEILRNSREDDWSASEELLLVEPIPSGARVVPASLDGCFERAEILPGRIVFFLNRNERSGSIHYALEGVFPGSNLVSPTVLRRAGRDAPLAVAEPKSLVVLPQGWRSTDPYRLSPDELLRLGATAKRKGDADAAIRYYTELFESWHNQPGFGLSEAAYKQTVVALMELGMGRTAPAKLVQYCEIIKEKWPAEPVTLSQLLTAAGAYREIGEMERSYMACRAAVEGSFTRESGVAGFLDDQGEFLRSVSRMNRLIRDYPPEPYVAEAEMELAQRVYAKAAEAPTLAAPDQPPVGARSARQGVRPPLSPLPPGEGQGVRVIVSPLPTNLRSVPGEGQGVRPPLSPLPPGEGQGVRAARPLHPPRAHRNSNARTLIGRAWQKLEAFLTGYPTDSAANRAAFAAANARLDLKQYDEAARAVTAYARRYPQSELLDSYWYISAYCDFATGRHASAIKMCRKVAETRHLDKPSGRMVDSVNKHRAIYILGQIRESLGQRADAIREYRRVADRIPDAKSSVAYFLRKQISLPDCTTLRPGTAAEVELSFRNIVACDVKVYRVNLMKFCEAAQALGDLSQVNLAGIRPLHESSLALSGGTDYCDHAQKVALPLKKEGAYLVVCRGEDLHASGLVLVSPLEIESRFDAAAGQVRVFIKDTTTGRYLSDVQVKLMPRRGTGQANVAGTTDLRGVFVGNCPAAAATIVAQAGSGRYAYLATQPPATDAHGAVAAAEQQADDPLAPFEVGQPPANQAVAVNQGPVAPSRRHVAAPAVPLPEYPLPPPGPNSPTELLGQGADEAAERKIRDALRQPTQLEFVNTPLKNVIDYLKDQHHIEIQFDSAALKEAGVNDSTPVNKNLKGISLRSALRLILDELQLKYVIHNGVLLITNPAKAESDEYMITKAYPVTDLVLPNNDGGIDVEPIKNFLTNTVATKSWQENGGPGNMSEMFVGNRVLLIVPQTEEVHEQIEGLLETLRKAGGLKTAAEGSANGEPAAAPRPATRIRQPAPVGQGMGGMGGGMGGMGGGLGGAAGGQTPYVISVIPPVGPQGDANLLGGLKSSNAANQKAGVLHLKQRQDAGQNSGMMGGGGGGGMF